MKNNKRSAKSSGKKSLTPKKTSQSHLIDKLLNKHLNVKPSENGTSNETALLLQTILSGSDESLREILQQWSNFEQIGDMIMRWGPNSSSRFFNRLSSILEDKNSEWAYPWIRQLLNLQIKIEQKNRQKLVKHFEDRQEANLQQLIKLQGKLKIFN